MTVKELKNKLAEVPDDTIVVVFESNEQIYIDAELAEYMEQVDSWTSDFETAISPGKRAFLISF